MPLRLQIQKIVSDPLVGLINISEFLPMIDVSEFQSLTFKYQLGLAFLLYPSATHTRKQHCLGAYQRTKDLMRYWSRNGIVTKDQARTVRAYALYHDIGHGPFSHTVEPLFDLLPKSKRTELRADDAMALEIVRNLRKKIESVGADFKLFYDLCQHKNPLYLAVHDKNLGMEKFDYLTRDAFYTVNEVPGVDYLSRYIYFVNNQIVVDEKAMDQARSIQAFYIKMSKHVYLRKKSAIIQRLIQKMAFELVKDGISVNDIWKLTDFGLLGRFELSKNPLIKHYYSRLCSGQFPKTAMDFKYKQFLQVDRYREDKTMHVFGFEEEILNKMLSHPAITNLQSLADVEKKIARMAKIPTEAVIVVPPMSHHRFVPEDINVYGRDGKIVKLSDFYPDHFAAMAEYGRSHHLLRVCAFSEYRDQLSKASEKIKDYLLSFVA